jgi:hypothetical protein
MLVNIDNKHFDNISGFNYLEALIIHRNYVQDKIREKNEMKIIVSTQLSTKNISPSIFQMLNQQNCGILLFDLHG